MNDSTFSSKKYVGWSTSLKVSGSKLDLVAGTWEVKIRDSSSGETLRLRLSLKKTAPCK